ncbi:MAG: UMP kinase [Thermoplasmatota archaeon]
MERVAIAFGGSILAPAELDPTFLRAVADRLREWSRDRQLFVVTGGGNPARRYIAAARAAGVAEESLDRIGIQATRLNAQSLAAILHSGGADVNLEIPLSVNQALRFGEQNGIVVMGGTVPGHSTDYVGIEIAAEAKAERVVIATNVDGVYTRDPNKHRDAKHIPNLSFDELLGVISERAWTAAGAPGVIDGPGTLLLATRGVPACVVLGSDLDNLGRAVRGEPFRGTKVAGDPVVLA